MRSLASLWPQKEELCEATGLKTQLVKSWKIVMEIKLAHIGKHFHYTYIFKHLSYHFETDKIYAITGSNGSGKSTLLQLISGFLSPSKGEITFNSNSKPIETENLHHHQLMVTPHLDLLPEFTLKEHLAFQAQFKTLKPGFTIEKIMDLMNLYQHRHKTIKYFSSGMVQRLRLALAILFESPLLLLDEPTSHLDREGIDWYKSLINDYSNDRCVIISSNKAEDYESCHAILNVEDYK